MYYFYTIVINKCLFPDKYKGCIELFNDSKITKLCSMQDPRVLKETWLKYY